MAAKKWWVGCGVGCGIMALAGIALVAAGFSWVRGTMSGFEQAIETRQALESRFGEVGDFTPRPDGAISSDRLERFLAVREQTDPSRQRISEVFEALEMGADQAREIEDQSFGDKMRFGLRMSRKAMGLAGDLGAFFEERNRALLDHDMGMGEYTYLYVVAFNSWLGYSPGDGPGGRGEADHPLSGRVSGNVLSMLRNQLSALPDGADDAWREALTMEIAASEKEHGRVPWKDGLPQATAESLEPFRERLETGYDRAANEFELARNKKDGFSIRAE